MKKIISLFLIIVIPLLGFSGCFFNRENPYPYRGAYKELYTTAIYSIPDAVGYMNHGEGAYPSDIYIWEKDDYRRTLFSYCEDFDDKIFGLVISQGCDDTNVYFYPDMNYALTSIDSECPYEGAEDDHLKNRTENFYLESKEKLKEANDWNKPINKTKCVSYPITDHKVLGEKIYSLRNWQCNEILNEYTKTLHLANPEKGPHRYHSILQVDAEGRVLHEIYGIHAHYDNPDWKRTDEFTFYSITLWVITDQDGNYDKENGVMVMFSQANEWGGGFVYNANEILEFKNKNGWKNHYCKNVFKMHSLFDESIVYF